MTDETHDDLDLLDQLLAEQGVDTDASHQLSVRPRPARIPLSFSQELLWHLDRATPGLTAYNMPIARRLTGPLDVSALERALNTVVARHEALRTRFVGVDGEPVQMIDAPTDKPLPVIDLSGIAADAREAEATRIVRERARTPFNLAEEAPFRATLLRLTPTDHVLSVETHHIVCDGWSMGVLFDELAATYQAYVRGTEPSLQTLPLQYADFAIWQREQLAGERLSELLNFWRTQLGDVTEPLSLPTDFPRPPVPTFTGARRGLLLPPALVHAVKQMGQQHGATLYMTLLAAYMTVLHRYTGRSNVLVGSGIAGRTERDTERLIGYFNNTLVQRGDFQDNPTFAELLGRVRDSSLGGYDHQEIPLEKLVLELREGQDRFGHAPLFEVVFTMQNTIEQQRMLGDVAIGPFGVDLGATKFDLTLLTTEREDGLWLALQYRSDLFAPATIDRLLGHLRTVLESAVQDANVPVSTILMLRQEEIHQLASWNAKTVNEGEATSVSALIETVAARVPTSHAVVEGDRTLTYAELDLRANQLAHRLQSIFAERRAPAAAPVGICLDRSIDAVIAMLAVLKIGSPYVPLPPDLPSTRLAQRIIESHMAAVVTVAAHEDVLPNTIATICLDREAAQIAAERTDPVTTIIAPDALAYILYTSGSTGVPKGVGITHRNIVHYTRAISRVLGDVPTNTAGDGLARLEGWRFGLVSTLGADLGNTSLFPALCSGGTLDILPSAVAMEPARFAEYVQAHPLDVLKITPNHLRALTTGRHDAELAAVLPTRWLVLGGEALTWDFAEQLTRAKRCRVLNHYGPTETTVGATTFEVTPESTATARNNGAQTVPIGSPLANTYCYVVDAHEQRLPLGIPGELYIGGDGVAAGYVNQPALTAERFSVDSFASAAGARMYRTGDRVRRHPNGQLEFLGRVDDQVKIRGYRVELGDIEHELAQHPTIAQAAVIVYMPSDTTESRLVAYVVPRTGGYAAAHAERSTPEGVTEWLRERVPEYMLPAAIIILEALPLSANGKLDRRALPDPNLGAGERAAFVAPQTETEIALAAIWSDVLKKEQVGATENFFTLGGHSLLAIRVLGRLSKQFGLRLPLRTLFDAPTVQELAVVVDRERTAAAPAAAQGITARARDAHRIRTTPGAS